MVKNYSELTRSLNKGFLLNEQELKRITDIISEQFDKLGSENKAKFNYTIKNFNGLVEETENIDYILKSENLGNSQIIELKISAISDNSDNAITLNFSNNQSERNAEEKAIRYTIKSEDRDWAIISSSLIDDRLTKISKKNFALTFVRKLLLISISIIMIGMVTYLSMITNTRKDIDYHTLKVINGIEHSINKGQNIDTLKSILAIEKSKLSPLNDLSLSKYLVLFFIPFMVLTLFLEDLKKIINKYFPTRIFYWGDYIEKYNKMISRRNMIIGFIFVTIIISLLINLFSNYIWEKVLN